jgi:4-amino-4-deoxy-L-arabinose transferase-like glycosyltransferase
MAQRLGEQMRGTMLRDAGLIIGLVVLATVPSMFTRDLWNPDEPRYMEVSRAMVLTGEYLIPHLNGKVYSEKPPLFFWLTGLLYRAGFGYNSGRVLSMLAVCGTLLIAYSLSRGCMGSQSALLAAAASVTCLLLMKFAQDGVLDPLLMFLETSALALGYAAMRGRTRRPALCWLGCYCAMGLAVLTKGPVGFIVPSLILLTYGILDRRNVRAGGSAHLIGLAAFAVIVLGWLLPAIAAGGAEYRDTILIKQNIGRAVNSYSHRNPFHYYLLWAPVVLFPWSLMLPLALAGFVRQRRRAGTSLPLFATVWLAVTLAFFSLVSGKRVNYVVPMAPAVGILIGWYFRRRTGDPQPQVRFEDRVFSVAFLLALAAAVLLVAALFIGPGMAEREFGEGEVREQIARYVSPVRLAQAVVLSSLPVAAALSGMLCPAGRRMRKAAMLAATILLTGLQLDLTVTPVVNTFKSAAEFAAVVNRRAAGGGTVRMYKNDFSGLYNLYTGRLSMPVISTPEEMKSFLATPGNFVIADRRHVRKALTPEEEAQHTLAADSIGHRRMVLLGADVGR